MMVVQRIRFFVQIPLCLGTMIKDDIVGTIHSSGKGIVKRFAPQAIGTLCVRIEKCEYRTENGK